MKNINIKNFRSLQNVSNVTINPLTVLLGRNSAGKSTFLRMIPLLKQSSEVRSRGVFLWSGNYVDFGDFETSLSHKNGAQQIEIGFEFELPAPFLYSTSKLHSSNKNQINVAIKITTSKDSSRPFSLEPADLFSNTTIQNNTKQAQLTTIELKYLEQTAEITFDDENTIKKFAINKVDFTQIASSNFLVTTWTSLIPSIQTNFNDSNKNEFLNNITKTLGNVLHGSTKWESRFNIAKSIKFGTPSQILASLKNQELGQFGTNIIKNWSINNSTFQKINNDVTAIYFLDILQATSHFLSYTFLSSKYITPLRSTAERYYRYTNIAIDEIDQNGSNTAMYLYNLPKSDLINLSYWCKENFDFGIDIDDSKSHISIAIEDLSSGTTSNIADTGFGYSQILPIVIQLWALRTKKKSPATWPNYIAIEQPELHLHPHMQGKLGRTIAALVEQCTQEGINIRLVIETHSEALINNIGRSIKNKTLSPSNCTVLLFEKESNGASMVSTTTFDEDGFLNNWPYGFFDA